MDFIDRIKAIAQKVHTLSSQIQNEQATKSAFIMPFIQALGYDIFDPTEVHPEYTADLPGIKGEKVDYAIIKDNKTIILIECKSCIENLENPRHSSQLQRYFHVTEADVGILTNGIIYRFFTHIQKNNVMDEKPFFEFNILQFDESSVNELKKFSKTNFNSNELEDVAKSLYYTKEIKRLMAEQLNNPAPDFVKFFANQVYAGSMRVSVVEKFTEIVKRSLKEFINERITERLVSAMKSNGEQEVIETTNEPQEEIESMANDGVITTEEELQSFYIIKSILREIVDISRIQYKDTKSYFGINIDGKVTKTICRLRLSDQKKSIGILDPNNKEAKTNINTTDDIYGLATILKDRVRYLVKENANNAEVKES